MASNLSRHHDYKLALPGVNRVPTGQPREPHATTRAIFFKEFSIPILSKLVPALQLGAFLRFRNEVRDSCRLEYKRPG